MSQIVGSKLPRKVQIVIILGLVGRRRWDRQAVSKVDNKLPRKVQTVILNCLAVEDDRDIPSRNVGN